MPTKRANIYQAKEWFRVLQTTKRSQTAVMTLGPGQSSGDEPEAHASSDQVLLLIHGELSAEIGGKRSLETMTAAERSERAKKASVKGVAARRKNAAARRKAAKKADD